MNKIKAGHSNIEVPSIALGCMRISKMAHSDVNTLINTSLEQGIDFFDHADIYGDGESETVFSKAIGMNDKIREKMILQSKCGIVRKGYFDFSKEHIIESVDGILGRLQTDYLDVLLLHRPDALVEPEEVAEAFNQLEASGKVRHFGVSNQNPMQIKLLHKYVKQDLLFNQLQLSIMRTGMIDQGFNVNMKVPSSVDHDGSILDYCRLHDITVQAWSPFQYGFFEGVFLDNPKFPELNKVIDRLANAYQVTNSAIAVAWILRHPAKIQTIIGTTNVQRVIDMSKATDIEITRAEWYEIYKAAGNVLP
ncbi:MAG: aldo/keto reductase [Vallitaleaceae bacterium]|jgi:predicted oxidoreductase|nr:aldo/keto reductase [Vallitaleaceae bacterium]